MMINREAYEQPNIPIKVKNKFINLLFQNRELEEVTYRKTIVCFLVIFFIFLAFSIFFFVAVSNVVEVRRQYYAPQNSNCTIGTSCNVSFTIPFTMTQPVYFMYELGNFYQNHRRYIQSKSNYQLAGNDVTVSQAQSCYPFITNSDMGKLQSWNGTVLNGSAVASPCGAIAYTFFNDTFQLYDGSGQQVSVNEQGISWDGDQGHRFRRPNNSGDVQWVDPQSEHFIVWMRTSGLPNFKKPWGIIQNNLAAGAYTVVIQNNYDSSQSNGNRYFILTTLSIVGGRNFILPIAFMVISMLSLAAVLFFWRRFKSLKSTGSVPL